MNHVAVCLARINPFQWCLVTTSPLELRGCCSCVSQQAFFALQTLPAISSVVLIKSSSFQASK